MFLGEQVEESESLSNEYKEFCIKTNVFNYFSTEELNAIIDNGKLEKRTFNDMILTNLQMYFDNYVPKYASAFTNSKVNGVVRIGVNDYNEVTGIPFCGQLQRNRIEKMINLAKRKYLDQDIDTTFKIIPLQIKLDLLMKDTEAYIEKVRKNNYMHRMINENYYREKTEWNKEVLKYSRSLACIIETEDTRTKFYRWLNFQKCDIKDVCLKVTPEDVYNIQNKRTLVSNKKSVIHWIAMFKDTTMEKIQKLKPVQPVLTKSINIGVYLLTHLSDIRHKLIENNKLLKYYVIDITYKNNTKKSNLVKYYKYNKKTVYCSFREEMEDGPCCVTSVN